MEMFRINPEITTVMTRGEIICGYIFAAAMPILMLAMWVITPA